ncbi:major tail protein [Acetanaerobacterium elongatum]|uniref:Phage major tail protein, phi13 family n=1 Tax=Acetanaerobacterium elongatum TaxID=258515 RepID=A0A1H0E903_9FIRM|nr:major tail protein [Acetanaerobacterium elongatum]SDN78862.1 phage major tail protein, phi13 family [Acetanaerobacterium elongatum]
MAGTGLQYLICAPITETAAAVTYTNGMVMSYAIKADISIEINEGKLYGDNRVIENVKEFKSGKLTLNGDHLSYEVLALLLGHTVTALTTPNAGKKLTAKGDDDGAFVGVGFYATTIKDGVRGYRAIWFHKVKFGIPNESLETKGDAINFQTPTIEGTILLDALGVWKDEAVFETEAGAKAWLDSIANMGGTGA